MSPRTDQELVSAFQNGDESAFNELVIRYQERLYLVSRRFMNDHAQADDVLQDSFVKIFHGLKSFRSESNIFTWMYRIVVNTSINALRRRKVVEFFQLDDLLTAPASDAAIPDEVLERDEQQRLIEEAIEKLPEKQKAVFLLRYYDELPYEEISAILNTSVGGLKANFFHAVKKITEHVRKAYGTR